ncbi:MAG: hypothetical protein M1526_04980 [Candidatus Thermoplasmatota archaeon]|jgi:hypothetical protein|nr:hypothetical protein [Candidatus Thermoplasmatota archaeon]MCL5681344.1 hypothetical protein [Candidatus Thermoplasmatota archaeon]
MPHLLPSRFKYPLFFLGLLIMEMAGLLFKFEHIPGDEVEGLVISGFLIFLFSIAAT